MINNSGFACDRNYSESFLVSLIIEVKIDTPFLDSMVVKILVTYKLELSGGRNYGDTNLEYWW